MSPSAVGLLSALLLLAAPGAAATGSAQSLPAPGPLSARDSTRAHQAARSEQSRFEAIRRSNLPWTWGGGGGSCDERIGRFCLSYGDGGETPWTPPPEAEETARAREQLSRRLAETARRLPGDGWVAGQRVRYLIEAGSFDEAAEAVAACRAARWWCAALEGYVHHIAGAAEPADSAFARMLREMPERERSEWTDLSLLLEGPALREYRRQDDAGRQRFEERFWRLADPFPARPGNDLRSEHFSRNLLDRLQDRAKSTEGIAWGSDLREILIRYGWPQGWERVRPGPGTLHQTEVSLVSHYTSADQDLLPPMELLLESSELTAGRWDRDGARARTGYDLRIAGERVTWFTPLEHQIAVFRRGDSAVVVAAYQLPRDSLPADARVDAGLALSTSPEAPPAIARHSHHDSRGALAQSMPTGPALLSLEVLAEEARRAGLTRLGLSVPPLTPGLIAISDLLVLRSPDALPDSLEDAIADARGSLRLRSGERVGVYWEVYGLGPDRPEQVAFSLRLVERGGGWLRRLAQRVGIVRELQPIRLRWREQTGARGYLARSLAVQIPPEIPAGSYALEITVLAPGREPLSVERSLEIGP